MRLFAGALLLLGACGSLGKGEPASLSVAYFESDVAGLY